jgi:hypothetical protein
MKGSYFSKDIQEFLILLHDNQVEYVIVGGDAVIYYGHARLTGDTDFFYEPSEANSKRMYSALVDFWAGDVPGVMSFSELTEPGMILQFGVPPNRIDLINQIDGVTFVEAWQNRHTEEVESSGRSIPVHFLGLDQLIKNKEATKRPKDVDDLKYLYKAREERE